MIEKKDKLQDTNMKVQDNRRCAKCL